LLYINVLPTISLPISSFLFLSPAPPPPVISTLSLHDALPILDLTQYLSVCLDIRMEYAESRVRSFLLPREPAYVMRISAIDVSPDRKSTRLNSSHVSISYAVFCLKKKKTHNTTSTRSQTGL